MMNKTELTWDAAEMINGGKDEASYNLIGCPPSDHYLVVEYSPQVVVKRIKKKHRKH